MRKTSCVIFAATALLWPAGAARAADAKICDTYMKEAVAKAQAVRRLGCGYELNDPRWAPGTTGHTRWCKTASQDAVVTETKHRRGQFKLCQLCRNYADLAAAAAADNASSKCGFSGARWSAKAEDHFGWCMAKRNADDAVKAIAAGSYAALTEAMEQSLGAETGDRTLNIASCKLRQPAAARRPPRT